MTHWFAVRLAIKHLPSMKMFFDAQRKLFPVNQHCVDLSIGFVMTACGQTGLTHVILGKC